MPRVINSKKSLKLAKYFILILIFSNGSRSYNLKIPMAAFFALCLLLLVSDVFRSNIERNNIWYYISLSLSITVSAVLKYFINGFGVNIFMFFYAIEILYIRGKIKKFLLIFHGTLYLTAVALSIDAQNISSWLTVLGMNFLTYSAFLCILYLSRTVRNEKEETRKLNEELRESNIKLREYALKVEELSIARERQRVAQELHDSLGHSLMALTMHLEFAEKIFDENPEKAREVILKAKDISKDSTSSLRMAVNTLKEERNIEDLRNAINELIDSFAALGNIKIDFSMDKHLETLNPDIKLCIYKTIRESLTNGIKHGKATLFSLKISIYENRVKLNISDNGSGCDTIIKSNGLKGMENRILALGGKVDFSSAEKQGFLINAEIPIYEEAEGND